jgi:uncharacterized protein (TIGR02594 family)
VTGLISTWRLQNGRVARGSGSVGVTYVQRALLAAGAQLPLDGEWGDITEEAVKRYQSAHDLPPTGWVGIRTAELLDKELTDVPAVVVPPPLPSVLGVAPWISYMRAVTGTKELPGDADSTIILSWAADIARIFPEMAAYSRSYRHDATAWCGLSMAWAMARAGVRPPFGSNDTERYLYAKSWASWGVPLAAPIPGCVMVFSRAGGGHVTTLEKIDGKKVWCRGGNQGDMVNVITKTLDSSFVAARWPMGFALPAKPLAGDISSAVKEGSFS